MEKVVQESKPAVAVTSGSVNERFHIQTEYLRATSEGRGAASDGANDRDMTGSPVELSAGTQFFL